MDAPESRKRKAEEEPIDKELEDEEDDDDQPVLASLRRKRLSASRSCPYLDTINRNVLDFDFEKLCSVSLSNHNVYACLVCGKYFQGRGRNTHAYFHALQSAHHVWLNLQTGKVYCLPDDYEVIDSSLDDVKFLLNPTFSAAQIVALDSNTKYTRCIDGSEYLPGIVGLNNIKKTDFVNVVIQALNRVSILRNYFLDAANTTEAESQLVMRFGELLRKLWNPRNFRSHVSPHELLQSVSVFSEKKFRIGEQSDPKDFLEWILDTLHSHILSPPTTGSSVVHKKKKGPVSKSIVHEAFRGYLKVSAETIATEGTETTAATFVKKVEQRPFLMLSMEIPSNPLFKDAAEKNVIPQVPLFTILRKFDGKQVETTFKGEHFTYVITELPRFLILHIKRFTRNNWFVEKNPAIVTFPIRNLDLREYTEGLPADAQTRYDLVANITHVGQPEAGKGSYKVHVQNPASEAWLEIQDLVVSETLAQLISVSEAYIQIWKRQDA